MTIAHPPTPEQQAILSAGHDSKASLMIRAYAGTGKSTTLEMLTAVLPRVPSLALAFNKKIATALESRFPANFTVKTMNGLGHAAWGKATGKRLEVVDKKLGKLITAIGKERGFPLNGDQWDTVRQMVSAAMQLGMTPKDTREGLLADVPDNWMAIAESKWIELNGDSEAIIGICQAVLRRNLDLAMDGQISFDDQVYCSALFGGVFPQFPQVMVDEAQDLSPLNHLQLAKVAGLSGRLIVCGDPLQAIYAFRGADSASMQKIKALRKEWIELPLATTFRCPKVVVQRQQSHAKGYIAFETAPKGEFYKLPITPTSIGEGQELAESWNLDDVTDSSALRNIAILCRNNAPLLSIAFKLIRQGVGVQMLGRDIGKQLVAMSKKLMPDDSTTITACAIAINEWRQKERSLALANDNDEKIAGIEDRAECLLAVCEAQGVKDAKDLRAALADLFERDHGVTLATGHRAKGLEWDTVLHLDPWRIPSKFAQKNPQQMEQELNLKYVIETRAKSTLIEANLEDFQ